jgi:hypothetical protein
VDAIDTSEHNAQEAPLIETVRNGSLREQLEQAWQTASN